MKPTYSGFEAKKSSGFAQMPPAGCYVAEIQGVKLEDSYNHDRQNIVLMLEIIEGEYKGQYHKVYEEQRESFGDTVKYRGTLRLSPYMESDPSWIKSKFEGNLYCVERSNDGYAWDWDESKLKGKKVGINVRKLFYTGRDGSQKETTEIAQLETVDDVRNGRCATLKDRVRKDSGATQSEYSDVSATVDVPF